MTNGYRRGSSMIFRRRKRNMEDNHIEAISGVLLLGILALFFFGTPMNTMIQKFITSVLGGGM